MRDSFSFRAGEPRDALMKWWAGLQAAHGDRAELRRCHSAVEVALAPAFHNLLRSLRGGGLVVNREALVVIAGALAHVEENEETKSLAKQMATPKDGGESPRVSGLRFRRLLKIGSREDLFGPLIRVVQLLNGRVNLIDLAESIYFWGERIRKQWAYDYYEGLK